MRTAAAGLLLALATGAAAQTLNPDPDSARIVTADVENFWRAYDRLGASSTREDSVRVLEEHYFRRASPGLAEFARLRIGGAERLADALGAYPRYYAAVRANTLRMGELEPAIREGIRRLEALYPEAVFPNVYFLIGRLNAGGTQSDGGLFIGTEVVSSDEATPMDELPGWVPVMLPRFDRIPCLVVHELVHYQQSYEPNSTLLTQALGEGVADFLAEKAVGCYPTASAIYAYGEAHERELWAEFREAMGGHDYSRWLANGRESSDRPPDLGYWMGYQIAEAYYERAADKGQAVRDLLHIREATAEAFLEASGYADRIGE